jgi:hypothetical protein
MHVNASGGSRSGITEIELRERLLEGRWYTDLRDELRLQLGVERRAIVGKPDISRNALLRTVTRLGVAYSPHPFVSGLEPMLAGLIGDFAGQNVRDDYQARGGYPMPSRLAQVQSQTLRYRIACNDAASVVTWSGSEPVVQMARSSDLRGVSDPRNPGYPIALAWRKPTWEGGRYVEQWEVWDLRGEPTWRTVVSTAANDDDIPDGPVADGTQEYVGDAYPFRWADGTPYIPAHIYHSTPTIGLFDRYTGSELSQGTLTCGVLWSFWTHCMRDAGWPQRYIEGFEPASVVSADEGMPRAVTADPATVLELARIDPAVPGTIGQWKPGADPKLMLEAVLAYEQSLDQHILPVPINISSTGGDPLETMERAREQYIAQTYDICREGDARILAMCANACNRNLDTSFPESPADYGVSYRTEIPQLTPAPGMEE